MREYLYSEHAYLLVRAPCTKLRLENLIVIQRGLRSLIAMLSLALVDRGEDSADLRESIVIRAMADLFRLYSKNLLLCYRKISLLVILYASCALSTLIYLINDQIAVH